MHVAIHVHVYRLHTHDKITTSQLFLFIDVDFTSTSAGPFEPSLNTTLTSLYFFYKRLKHVHYLPAAISCRLYSEGYYARIHSKPLKVFYNLQTKHNNGDETYIDQFLSLSCIRL